MNQRDCTSLFREFCQSLTDAMNFENMKYANGLISVESVMKMDEAIRAFQLSYNIAQVSAI